jgi:hemoglobin-like flavoprotein
MDAKQIQLVQRSFEQVQPIAEQAAGLFYGRLFELDPQLEMLFKADIKEQGRKLMAMIGAAVSGLDDIAALVPVVQELARRHLHYGVEAGHYTTVGDALLWTLRAGLGTHYTDEVHEAWVATYTLLSNTMQDAAYAS